MVTHPPRKTRFRLLVRLYRTGLVTRRVPSERFQVSTILLSRAFLARDQVFLLERFFYFLEGHKEHGLLVMDEVEKTADRRFVRRLHRYFANSATGRYRSRWIVPSPFFVASDMTYPVQAADLCIYCTNWGFRLPSLGMDAEVRTEIADEFGPWLDALQFRGESHRGGVTFKSFGVAFVPDPYNAGGSA